MLTVRDNGHHARVLDESGKCILVIVLDEDSLTGRRSPDALERVAWITRLVNSYNNQQP
jgi:hypothetical protein